MHYYCYFYILFIFLVFFYSINVLHLLLHLFFFFFFITTATKASFTDFSCCGLYFSSLLFICYYNLILVYCRIDYLFYFFKNDSFLVISCFQLFRGLYALLVIVFNPNRTNMPTWAFVVLGLIVAVSGRPIELFVSPEIHLRTGNSRNFIILLMVISNVLNSYVQSQTRLDNL